MEDANILQMLVSGQNDLAWFESNLDSFKSKFNNKFIAFHNKEILFVDSDLDNLMKKLKEKNVDSSNIFIKFVSKVRAIL